jgi:TolB protein
MENQVRELLRDIAEDIEPRRDVPPTLHRRARRRIVVAVGTTLVAVAALLLGTVVAVRSISTSAPPRPANPGPTTGQSAPFTRARGWITYVGGGGSAIVAVDPTHPANRITLGPADGRGPIAWSGDGSRLLLRRSSDTGSDLYIMKSDGSVTRLARGGYSGASFSPDGTMVVYEYDLRLYVVDADGGTPRLLAVADPRCYCFLGSPAWSPDGSRIAFTQYDENKGTFSIGTVEPDGTGRREVIDLGECGGGGCTGGLAWAPDGQRLAFHSRRNSSHVGFDIYVVSADGSGLRQITARGGDNEFPAWSPDGSRIAFLGGGPYGGPWSVFTMNADGGDVQDLEAYAANFPSDGIAWNPAG